MKKLKEYDMVSIPGGMPESVNLRDDERLYLLKTW